MVNPYSHKPRKRFGQNFLVDTGVADRIVIALNPDPADAVVEIGPGRGALTGKLATRIDALHVIEIDRDLAAELESGLAREHTLTIHCADALEYDFAALAADRPLRVVGNLPYNISTPLMFHLFGYARHIADMHLMLQKEVVDRLAAAPGTADYGRLSVMAQYYARVERLFGVKPGAFHPVPKVDSAVVRLTLKPASAARAADERVFASIVKQGFAQRRKTLKNNLKGTLDAEAIRACDIDPGARAETLSVADFIRLADRKAAQAE